MLERDRLVRLLGTATLDPLVARLRQRLERGHPLTGTLVLSGLGATQREAVAALLGRPPAQTGEQFVSVPLDELAAALAAAGVCDSLARAIVELTGPVENSVEKRAEARQSWDEVFDRAPAALRDGPMAAVVARWRETGSLKRVSGNSPVAAAQLLDRAAAVMAALPAGGRTLAQLAAEKLGHAHALDTGEPLTGLVLQLAAARAGAPAPTDTEERRHTWAAAGVLCDELSAPALALNLPASGRSFTATLLRHATEAGEPIHLSLRTLLRHPLDTDPALRGRTVFVCENATVVAFAAERLGARCAPLVTIQGQYATATSTAAASPSPAASSPSSPPSPGVSASATMPPRRRPLASTASSAPPPGTPHSPAQWPPTAGSSTRKLYSIPCCPISQEAHDPGYPFPTAPRPPMPPAPDTLADLLPARMLNEFVYCPRLFFYEHVEGVFVHNADTLRGKTQHERVDSGSGAMPKARKKAAAATPGTAESAPADSPAKPETQSEASGDPESTTPYSAASAVAEDTAAELSAPAIENRQSEIENEVIHSRSVMLGSETLGVVAKLDLVETTLESVPPSSPGGAAAAQESSSPRMIESRALRTIPVEYKSGPPRATADGTLMLWDADRIQLGLQMLLLRENGYACDEGVVYYRQTRQRVRFTLDADSEVWIRRQIAAARACSGGPIPAPLEHSPKCQRCSLVSVCLPDETNLLRTGPDVELPPPEAQLALPGLLPGTNVAPVVEDLTETFAADDPIWDSLPEPRFPRPFIEGDVRRLITPDIDTKALYVNTPGVGITKKGETVVVKDQGETVVEVRIKDLHHLAIFGSAQLSTALVQTLCERDIPISFFSMGGWFYGLARGHGLTNVFTRIKQFARAADPEQSLPLARLFVYGKIRNQRTLLRRNHVEPPPLVLRILKHAASAALVAPNHASLLGIEGAAALSYFRHFGGMIKGPEIQDEIPGLDDPPPEEAETVGGPPAQALFTFDFKTRNRRPPRDPVNALLSLAYSLLARDCTIAAHAVGFDPYVGFFHQPRFGRPALALDVMEEFRPLVADSVVLTAINNRMLGPGDFVQAGDAVNLTTAGRKRFLFAYEKRMGDTVTHPIFDYKVSYRRAIELQFRLLARTLTGEIDRYVPFTTR